VEEYDNEEAESRRMKGGRGLKKGQVAKNEQRNEKMGKRVKNIKKWDVFQEDP